MSTLARKRVNPGAISTTPHYQLDEGGLACPHTLFGVSYGCADVFYNRVIVDTRHMYVDVWRA